MTPAKVQPALLGGVTIGVLSALPVVNCCCCAWILFGGGLSAYLMQQNHPEPIEVGDGAIVGLNAGWIGAIVWLIVSIPINTAMAPFQSGLVQQVLRESPTLSPALRAALESSADSGIGLGLVFGFFVMLVLMTTMGMLGGIFGALLFRKKPNTLVPPPIPE